MRIAALALAGALTMAGAASAQTYVSGYTRSDGTYVAPHYRAEPTPGYTAPQAMYGAQQPDHQVSGYVRQNGTYVNPYMATNPNGARQDNYSTQGNVNPYTGQPGHKSPW